MSTTFFDRRRPPNLRNRVERRGFWAGVSGLFAIGQNADEFAIEPDLVMPSAFFDGPWQAGIVQRANDVRGE